MSANSEDADKMTRNMAFHQGLHCLLRQMKGLQYYLEIVTYEIKIIKNYPICKEFKVKYDVM